MGLVRELLRLNHLPGSQMVHELFAGGVSVVVFDNLSTGRRWVVAEGVPLIVDEIGDQRLVARPICTTIELCAPLPELLPSAGPERPIFVRS